VVNIRKLDLNLFIVLEALVREHSVTRAADRLGLSQPAVSAALKRLRQQLDDPLLVRTRDGMLPTPRAQEIYSSFGHSLDALQNVLQDGPAFAPERTQRSFNLMLSDIGEIVYLPRLIGRLQRAAPLKSLEPVASILLSAGSTGQTTSIAKTCSWRISSVSCGRDIRASASGG
jgi:DNA-binding transcriptional LysR family regulator